MEEGYSQRNQGIRLKKDLMRTKTFTPEKSLFFCGNIGGFRPPFFTRGGGHIAFLKTPFIIGSFLHEILGHQITL